MPLPGNSTERGYDSKHRRLRAGWDKKVQAGDITCARCQKLIPPTGYRCPACGKQTCGWDLDHTEDRSGYLGPSHSCCNRATATHKAVRRHQAQAPPDRRSRDW